MLFFVLFYSSIVKLNWREPEQNNYSATITEVIGIHLLTILDVQERSWGARERETSHIVSLGD